jgi:hypothetical protein
MGHITVTGANLDEVKMLAKRVKSKVKVVSVKKT